jgi:uncharacterized protein YggE
MKRALVVVLSMLVAAPGVCRGQESGNVAFSASGAKARAEQSQRSKRAISKDELPTTGTSMFVEASVLMNVKPDEFVAVFGLMQEGASVEECVQKMDASVKQFAEKLAALGITADDLFVDFVAQHKIYGFELMGDVAREKLVGFELKKNVSIRYRDRTLLDKLVSAAAALQIFDLIKVDCLVRDTERVQEQLIEEAARIIKQKSNRYERLLGIKLQPPAQVFAERTGVYYPGEMYDFYTAAGSEVVDATFSRQRYATQTARKSRTFFLNALDADGFDSVIDPGVIEPAVQFTIYLKLKYEVEQIPAK